ncbi:hypothetical protein [Pseudovibrio sp. Tun.PSC04-5.I4]|uniref:hypothetical protein n=1 Tax=Pseudovibrio sp. Tun.PSC04-5.I4 TaxID=1798213 RepID=UPI00087F026C|nr:hypothetical protein [Pseudovibrio sp. Tun.PSC04-5.I4]SDR48907.1 hypothetical protein SAMN04515695_6084 [Pseudovibrio sp. Tun.PSC04-5.I4]
MFVNIGGTEYRVDSVTDLTSRAVTDLYNTGRLNDRYTFNHAGAVTVYVPQISVFEDTYLGRLIDPGFLPGIQALLNGDHKTDFQSFLSQKMPSKLAELNANGSVTLKLGEFFDDDLFKGPRKWNTPFEHGGFGIGEDQYVDFAYVLGTQNFTLDPDYTEITLNQGRRAERNGSPS